MAETVRESLALDVVLFVPTRIQPLKVGTPVTSAEHRVAMVERAIMGNPHFALSRVEVDRAGPSYTADTLELLRAELDRSDVAMWFIVGTDSLLSFPRWREPARILAQARLAVVRRPDVALPDMSLLYSGLPVLEGAIDWIDAPLVQISATDLRSRVAQGRSIRYRVPEGVREYIEANGLYR
jgi:nicotinate-nucleotide adenylyltransferase